MYIIIYICKLKKFNLLDFSVLNLIPNKNESDYNLLTYIKSKF